MHLKHTVRTAARSIRCRDMCPAHLTAPHTYMLIPIGLGKVSNRILAGVHSFQCVHCTNTYIAFLIANQWYGEQHSVTKYEVVTAKRILLVFLLALISLQHLHSNIAYLPKIWKIHVRYYAVVVAIKISDKRYTSIQIHVHVYAYAHEK